MNKEYGRITQQNIDDLTVIAGRSSIIKDSEELREYSCDEMPLAEYHVPGIVVKPAGKRVVSELMDYANQRKIPVTPMGARTGLSGGCIPVYGGIVLSLERMNRILEIDKGNFVAVVEPGVRFSELYSYLEQQGLYYPLRPGESSATIGGSIATNAGGLNAVKYGVTRHNVLGLEAVLPDGSIIKTGGKFVKCSTGYDLTQLIIGSEGTLAVITEAILKLSVKPASKEVLFVPFRGVEGAIDAVPEVLMLDVIPAGIEFIEREIIGITENYLGREIPYHDYEAFLMIIMEGDTEKEICQQLTRIENICRKHGALEAFVPGSSRARKQLLEVRESFYHALKAHALMEVLDVVVPRNKIAEFVRTVKELSANYHIPVVVYGHAGDGNVHLHPVCRNMSREEWKGRLPQLINSIYDAGISLGGAISGEHGIGLAKMKYYSSHTDKALMGIIKGIKNAFDPNNILNPGKVFDL